MEASAVLSDDMLAGNNSVIVSLPLKLTGKTGGVLDFGIITSAYGRTVANAQGLTDTSDILFVANEKTDSRLKALGLQLPSAITNYGSIGTVTFYAPNVKNDTSEKAEMAVPAADASPRTLSARSESSGALSVRFL